MEDKIDNPVSDTRTTLFGDDGSFTPQYFEALLRSIERPFPDPWIEGATVNGYRIDPITSADDLEAEGERMHNCVGGYADVVMEGGCYFYHVSKAGERIATVQLSQTEDRFVIEQIKGVCNQEVSGDVLMAARHWIATKGKLPYEFLQYVALILLLGSLYFLIS